MFAPAALIRDRRRVQLRSNGLPILVRQHRKKLLAVAIDLDRQPKRSVAHGMRRAQPLKFGWQCSAFEPGLARPRRWRCSLERDVFPGHLSAILQIKPVIRPPDTAFDPGFTAQGAETPAIWRRDPAAHKKRVPQRAAGARAAMVPAQHDRPFPTILIVKERGIEPIGGHILGSGPVAFQSQYVTVAASALTEKAAFGHRSSRVVAGHRGPPVFRPPEHDLDMGCLDMGCGVCRVASWYPTGFRAVSDRGCRGMQARLLLSFDASPNRAASEPRSPGDLWQAVRQCLGFDVSNAIADLNGADERAGRPALVVRRMACNLAFMRPPVRCGFGLCGPCPAGASRPLKPLR